MRKKKYFTKKQRKACRGRNKITFKAPKPATAELGNRKFPNHAQRKIDRAMYQQSSGDSKLQHLKKKARARMKTIRRAINKVKRSNRKLQRRRGW